MACAAYECIEYYFTFLRLQLIMSLEIGKANNIQNNNTGDVPNYSFILGRVRVKIVAWVQQGILHFFFVFVTLVIKRTKCMQLSKHFQKKKIESKICFSIFCTALKYFLF